MTVGPIEAFMVADHVRLDQQLAASERNGGIDEQAYAEFRHDLLRHIAMEEKVLLPFLRSQVGTPFAAAAVLRADHGEIAKLLVRSPTQPLVDALRVILGRHNPLEEGHEGLYATCDRAAGGDAEGVVDRLRAQPTVPVAKYYDGPLHQRK